MKTGDYVEGYTTAQACALEILVFKGLLVPDMELEGFTDGEGKLLITIDEETGEIEVATGLTAEDNITYVLTDDEKLAAKEEFGEDISEIRLIFVSGTSEPETISELSVTAAEPVAGELPSDPSIASGEGYTIVYFEWIDVVEETKLYPEDGDTFEAGKQYTLWVEFEPEDGYVFDTGATVKINGMNAEEKSVTETYAYAGLTFTAEAEDDEDDEEIVITSLSATITAPKAGEKPSLTLTTPSDEYSAVVDCWYEGGTVADPGDVITNPEEYTFQEGKTYILDVNFIPANEDVVIADDATAKINGKTAEKFDEIYSVAFTIEVTPVHEHEYGDEYKHNKTYHWKECVSADCDDAEDGIKDKEEHDFAGSKCTVCGYKKTSGGSSSSAPSYKVETEETKGGKVKTSKTYAEKGQKVYITVTPDEGFEIDEITVTDKDGDEIEVKKEDGRYSFTMPKSKVEIEVTFAEIEKETEKENIVLTIDSTVAWLFDEYVINDVAPVIRNDRTMLPIRFIAEALGAEVAWDDSLDKVIITKDDLEIEIYIGSAVAFVNGETVDLDSPAFIENDRTYLPLRFVAENLGAEVIWNGAERTVTIIPGE